MTEPGYSVQNATTFGWGPDSRPDPQKVAALRRHVIGPDVLDVGCASGTYVDLLATDGFTVTGLDAFPEFLREAAARGRSGKFVQGEATSMPFPDRSFDTVILFDILEHLDDQAVVAEAVRVARQRVLVLVPLTDPPELLRNNFVFQHHRDRTHLREYSRDDLARLFTRVGWHIGAVQPLYPANVRGLLADSLRLPAPFRFVLRAFLRLLKPAFKPHFSEIFLVAEVGTRN